MYVHKAETTCFQDMLQAPIIERQLGKQAEGTSTLLAASVGVDTRVSSVCRKISGCTQF